MFSNNIVAKITSFKCLQARASFIYKLYSENIVQLLDMVKSPSSPHLVFEYMNGRSLDSYLMSQCPLAIARGLYELHDYIIVHHDLRSRNVLLFDDKAISMSQ
ncbi:hypothetical protein THRCLA_22718 [Thraustotheca clavata]|uniref:Protein kinase domain-containing protein n=1 Tax=Thraustotheca clavata TaxID=74557 RepID=A0A1V9YUL1_9STRA|nr:hypothetical protein THRCLA_22718 [Thraustotheca clavata]